MRRFWNWSEVVLAEVAIIKYFMRVTIYRILVSDGWISMSDITKLSPKGKLNAHKMLSNVNMITIK